MKDEDQYYWFGMGAATLLLPWVIFFMDSLFLEFKLATTILLSLSGVVILIYVVNDIKSNSIKRTKK